MSGKSSKKKVVHKFTQAEDELLKVLAHQYGEGNWAEIAKQLPGVNRKQVRDRYVNYLKGYRCTLEFTKKEDATIIKFVHKHGKKWCTLSELMKGRTPIMLKNRYYSNLRYKEKGKFAPSRIKKKKIKKNT